MPTLTWLTRKESMTQTARAPYRALVGLPALDYGRLPTDNLLIQGDNLHALKALCPYFAGQVKCIFIDPPYNTRQDFDHYQDNLQHTQWLEMMYPRLMLLNELLAEDGSIWITLNDIEAHYFKVLADEVFGRKNFISNFIWEKKRKASFLGKQVGVITDNVFCYAKNKKICAPFIFGQVSENETYPLYNAGNRKCVLVFRPQSVQFNTFKDGHYEIKEYANRTSVVKLVEPLVISDGWNANNLVIEGEWRYSQKTVDEHLDEGEHYVVKSNSFRLRRVVSANTKGKKIHNMLSRAHYNMATNEDAAKEVLNIFGQKNFDYPKPEGLLHFIISVATKQGDLVLDSFLGSGTTAAVAHKMGRRWIGIEMGEHAETHCALRLRSVIDGEQGGISEAANWQGGGGFHFLRLGGAVFTDDGDISPAIKFPELAAYIWFAETRVPLPQKKRQNPFLGIHNGIGYALLYNGILGDKTINGGNVLIMSTLAHIRQGAKKHKGKIIVYGESCRLGENRLKLENIEFRQLPYECKKR